jgi:hypothetical protein
MEEMIATVYDPAMQYSSRFVLCETRAARPKPSSITLVYRIDSLLVLHISTFAYLSNIK